MIENMRNCFRAGQFKCTNVKLPTVFHCWEIAAHSEEWLGVNPGASPTKATIENGVANAPSCLQPTEVYSRRKRRRNDWQTQRATKIETVHCGTALAMDSDLTGGLLFRLACIAAHRLRQHVG
jgi:hypothetical protein